MVKIAFVQLGIHELHGENELDNPASGRVLEKAGFEKVAVFKDHAFSNGEYVDIVHWSLFNPGG